MSVTVYVPRLGGTLILTVTPPPPSRASGDIMATVLRGGTQQITQHLYVQLDLMSQKEASYHGGEAPYMRYAGYALTAVAMQYRDLLQDEANTDPLSGAKRRYRVISDPEYFPDGHVELVLDRVLGTPN